MTIDHDQSEIRSTQRTGSSVSDAVILNDKKRVLRLDNITKDYGNNRVLNNINLDLYSSTIHGFLGENGAGKSTCVSVISGRVSPSRGELEAYGVPLRLGSPRAALKAGIAAVYQELMVIGGRTALENVLLPVGSGRRGPLLRPDLMKARYSSLLERLGETIPANIKARELSWGRRQMLEIARALNHDVQFLLFDEPTTALSVTEKSNLFRLMNGLRSEGVGIVLVTHDLAEMQENANVISVFRDGLLIETRLTSEWSRKELVAAMAGPRLAVKNSTGNSSSRGGLFEAPIERKPPLLRLTEVNPPTKHLEVNLEVWEGEIVGLAGLMGSGRSSLLRCLAGYTFNNSGTLEIRSIRRQWPSSPREGHKLGFHYLPEDRKIAGIVPNATGSHNILLGSLVKDSRLSLVRRNKAHQRSKAAAERVRLRPNDLAVPARELSGGTQQKLLLARALVTGFDVLLADEPTRGVDVNARAEIWDAIREMVADGRSAVVSVSDLDELLEVADRLVVFSAGGNTLEMCGATGGTDRATLVEAMF